MKNSTIKSNIRRLFVGLGFVLCHTALAQEPLSLDDINPSFKTDTFYALYPAEADKCGDYTRVLFDVGSSSIKVEAWIVDTCNDVKKTLLLQEKVPHNVAELFKSGQHSAALKLVADLIIGYKDNSLKRWPKPVQSTAVLTAEFRYNRGKGSVLGFDALLHTTTGITAEIISQEIEGGLAYHGILDKLKDDKFSHLPDNVRDGHFLSWDVGGGSQQLSARGSNGDITVHGSSLGAGIFYDLVRKFIRPELSQDLFPLNDAEIKQAKDIVKLYLLYPTPSPDIKDMFENDITVFGVGGMHSRSILPLVLKAGVNSNSQRDYYTRSELGHAIDYWKQFQTDEEFKNNCGKICQSIQDFTNLLLTQSVMEHFGIETVRVVQANSMETAILRYNNWTTVFHKPATIMKFDNFSVTDSLIKSDLNSRLDD